MRAIRPVQAVRGAWSWWWAKRWRKRLGIAGAVMLVMSIVSVEVTSQSWFCNSCHIMGPYYKSWQTGTHKSVDCVACHIPPGTKNFIVAKLNGAGQVVDDLLSRTSSKPSASVSDFACTRAGCHDIAKLKAEPKKGGKYLFEHGKHLGLETSGIEVHCTTCHSHVKGSNHFEVNTNSCVSCHLLKPGEQVAKGARMPPVLAATPAVAKHAGPKVASNDCRTCHDAPSKPIEYRGMKVVHAEYVAYGAACESCHSGVTEKPRPMRDEACFTCHEFGLEKLGSVEETHKVHSTGRHKVECFSCHGEPKHGPAAQSMQLAEVDCRSCHIGQHQVQKSTYTHAPPEAGSATAHVPADAGALSPMFMVHVSCSGCHTQARPVTGKAGSGAVVMAASKTSCDNCHKDGAGEQVPLWQKATHQLYDGVTAMMPPIDRPLDKRQRQLVAEARSTLELVRLDGSWGVHNPRYTQKLLEEAQRKLVEVNRAASPATRPATGSAP